MDQVEELRADVRDGNCIVIVGTGVSSALSGGDPKSSWVGLLRSGLESALQMGSVNSDIYQRLGSVLDAPDDVESLLGVASDLVEALGGPEGRDFAHWLRTDVGYLDVKDPSLAKALVSLRIPILTTNYDDLIEKATGRDHVTWQDANVLQLVISNKSRQIGHLHGYWAQPKSIVLTSEQYQLMLEDRQFEFVRQAMMAVNSIIYVGFGTGLDDPNFTNLRRWMIDLFPSTQIRHYRLCLDDEWEALVDQHRDENIYPIRYGSSHSDMTNFLTGIAPSQREVVPRGPDTWFQIIEEHARGGQFLRRTSAVRTMLA